MLMSTARRKQQKTRTWHEPDPALKCQIERRQFRARSNISAVCRSSIHVRCCVSKIFAPPQMHLHEHFFQSYRVSPEYGPVLFFFVYESLSVGQCFFLRGQRFSCMGRIEKMRKQMYGLRIVLSILAVFNRHMGIAHMCSVRGVCVYNDNLSLRSEKKMMWAKCVLNVTSPRGSSDKANHVLIGQNQ